jgi:CheY-like chemotaxis protein
VHAIVQRSRGGIAVESQPGSGTTFQVYLPYAAAAAREEPEPAAVEPAEGAASATTGAATGRASGTLLLVEDDEMFRGLLRQVLETQGYQVLAAENPAVALELAAAYGNDVRLMLSDIVMPGGNGADLAAKLLDQNPALKVVLMSGYTDDALAGRDADLTKADAFLEKPFATQELLRLIRELLSA